MSESETGELLSDTINVTFVELCDFRKDEGECGTMLDKWLFVRLFESVEVTRMTQDEMNAYDRARLAEFDRINILRSAENSGLEKGRAEGRTEGLAESLEKGAVQKELEIARKMKAKGMDAELIAQCTGLLPEQIESL